MPDALLPASEMARQLGVRLLWLLREGREGRLPCVVVDRTCLFDADAVFAVLKQRAGVACVGGDGTPDLVTLKTLSRECMFSVDQLREMVHRGELRAFKLEGRFVIEREHAAEVLAVKFLQSSGIKVKGVPDAPSV